MRVLDRYRGDEVDLPEIVAPGRYRVLTPCSLNGDIALEAGQILLSDGRDRCCVGGQDAGFLEHGETESESADRDLLAPALRTLALFIEKGGEQALSPLMPAKLGELAKLDDLEKCLVTVVTHLREIDSRPRFSMHYEAEVAPLSRAKRIAPAAIMHLAAHSEHWHRRSLSGVQPKQILALFSEDEWAIYENRVFARLLDHLHRYLKHRLAEVIRLHEKYQNALSLGQSEQLYYRMRESLCTLWGAAMSIEDTGLLLETANSSIGTIQNLIKTVSVLRQGELYRCVPRNAQVPEQLRDTNILQHDQHYRHLRTLWRLHQKGTAEMRAAPTELHDRNRRLFDDYVLYLGMLARRVLAECKLLHMEGAGSDRQFSFAGTSGRLRQVRDEWVLDFGKASLSIVPALFPPQGRDGDALTSSSRVVVFLFSTSAEPAESPDSSVPVIVSPLEFYGLERMRVLIESFLWRPVFADYGKALHKLPAAALEWLSAHGIGKANGNGFVMLEALSVDRLQAVTEWLLSAPINEQTASEIRGRVYGLGVLASCRCCGKPARLEARDGGFKAVCGMCSIEWSLVSDGNRRKATFTSTGSTAPSFETHGGWHMEIGL